MASRGVFRGVYSVLFDDPDYQELPPHARLVLLTVRLCAPAGPAVIFEYSVDRLMRQSGLDHRTITTALATLQKGGWIDRDASLLWVCNGLKYDPLVSLANPRHKTGVLKWLAGLPKRPIVLRFCDYYSLPYPFDRLSDSHSIGTLKEKEKEKDKEKEKTLPFADIAPAISAAAPSQTFHIPDPITAALRKAPRLSRSPKLQEPDFWQAQIRAHNGINFPAELLKAEAWLVANRPKKNLPRFLANWFATAHGDAS